MLEVARKYTRRGWKVLSLKQGSKNPGKTGWQQLRYTEEELPQHFNGKPCNIGVLQGEPSGWIIDIDLDHPKAVELADKFLPDTPAVFGRESKRRSHYIYRVTGPIATKKYKSKSAGMIVEIRSTGCQTVFPPSTHESGEAIEWETEDAEPAEIDPDELFESVKRLADEALVRLGEKQAKPKKVKPAKASAAKSETSKEINKTARCLASLLRLKIQDQNDGSHRLYVAACRAVEHDLSDREAIDTINAYAKQKPFRRAWSDDEILQRVRDAEKQCQRGAAYAVDEENCIALGCRDPETGKLVLSPRKTLPTAQAYVNEFASHPDGLILHNYGEQFLQWKDNRFSELEDGAIKHQLQQWLHDSLRYTFDKQAKELRLIGFDSNSGTINSATESLRAYCHLPASVESPCWLDGRVSPDPRMIVPCRSTLLDLSDMRHLPPTPLFFTRNALEFDPDPNAPPPTLWLEFLHQLFDDDIASQELLQEWFGYCLTGDTSQQKMLLMIGPKRGGKGTIGRVQRKLVGEANVASPTTSSLAGTFGLQPLLGKTLATVSDARFSGDNIMTVVERLLCISGEDAVTIDRKYLTSVTTKLATRFMFLTNETPRFNDASGALAGRFMILRLSESFYGREDPMLTEKLYAELPGILNWAIEGWKRLHERGRFVMPASVEEAMRELEEISSPVKAFVREKCVVGPAHRVYIDDLYLAWQKWCIDGGRTKVTTKARFGADLTSAFSQIKRRRDPKAFYDGINLLAQFGN